MRQRVEASHAEIRERLRVLRSARPTARRRRRETVRPAPPCSCRRSHRRCRACRRPVSLERPPAAVGDEGHGLDHEVRERLGATVVIGVELGLEAVHEVVAGIEDEVRRGSSLPRLVQRRHHERIVGVAAVLGEAPAARSPRMPGQAVGIGLDQLVDDGRIGERVEMDVGEDQEHALVGAGANGRSACSLVAQAPSGSRPAAIARARTIRILKARPSPARTAC